MYLLDVDEVVVLYRPKVLDFILRNHLESTLGKKFSKRYKEVKDVFFKDLSYNFNENFDMTKEELQTLHNVIREERLYDGASLTKLGKAIKDSKSKVAFVTKGFKGSPSMESKIEFLNRHFPNQEVHVTKTPEEKGEISKKYDWKVYIDDQWDNVRAVLDHTDPSIIGGKEIILPRYSWNRVPDQETIDIYTMMNVTFSFVKQI